MKTWLTADWHLGETRFNLMMRPFKHATEQVEKFVSIHNALVAPNDRVIVIGDAVNQNAPNFLPYINFFNGIKTLIRGNHDRPFSDDDLAPYFEHIVKEDEGMEFDFGGIPCYLIHYPTCARADRFNLVLFDSLSNLCAGRQVQSRRPRSWCVEVPTERTECGRRYEPLRPVQR
jgi:calcineurin-like phosphoesterase family protein